MISFVVHPRWTRNVRSAERLVRAKKGRSITTTWGRASSSSSTMVSRAWVRSAWGFRPLRKVLTR